jgi:uncharacterized protein DUF1501
MLSFTSPHGRFSRREFLGIGSIALGGLPMVSWAADATSAKLTTERSVIFLFLQGGPSQFETFDPKMSAPVEIRSATGEVKTSIPGVTFGGSFPKLAKLADRVAIVRSFMTGDANHDIKPIVGRDTFGANIGSMYSHVAGGNDPMNGMPLNVALFPQSVDSTAQPRQNGFGNFLATGAFGAASAPFVPGGDGPMQKNLTLNLPLNRLDDRRALLRQIDRMKANFDDAERAGLDEVQDRAIHVLLGNVASAFDLSKESPRIVDKYDTAPVVRPEKIDKKWNNHKFYADNAKTLGKLLLMARRLCERGCRFVTVTTNFVWDMHSDVNNAGMVEGMGYVASPLDHALAAFLEDVESRGLSEKILLVACGEMGRSPRINAKGGRDHWGNLAPLLLAGGGLPMGRVIGQSTRNGGEPATEPVTNRHLVSTIMHSLFDIGQLRVQRGLPRELQQVTEWPPIPGLIS